ncbi:MAG: hypothetical protein K6T78_01085 [Alicyclobacillus sp.]|nr:hypothetical protein [Alicyclobacillus sp.]
MTRLVRRAIRMCERTPSAGPWVFEDQGRRYQVVEVIDTWAESGAWWAGEADRRMWRVLASEGAVLDLEQSGDDWFVYRVWD